ncbi:AbrB family transcriptional regulator [Tetragenococcus osmophilus]|uniref:AbrB family transcriptional regulator n=1 Tax=Tetragenococcus osmophilus TaxID=526944 RepID=A0ABM7A7C7_9ENTE|nr:AbrB family transcriptional regulator [Tetragenococcus osmophilus]
MLGYFTVTEYNQTGKEYLVSYGEDGTIVLIPKIEDPFVDVTEGAFYETDVWGDMPAVGKEM